MSSSTKSIETLAQQEYKYGWKADFDADELPPGLNEDTVRFIVSLTGIDGTFSQTVHARVIYDHTDVRWWQRFVDIVGNTEDGRLSIDYRRFHDTVPIDDDGPRLPVPSVE